MVVSSQESDQALSHGIVMRSGHSSTLTERVTKGCVALCLILCAVASLAIRNSPATGYESSIYWSTPPLAWGCLFFSIACGIAIAVYEVSRGEEHGNLWVLGLLLILVSNVVILSLPTVRGYYMWNGSGDAGSHFGAIQDLLAKGYIEGDNFYPIAHIYLAQVPQILGVPLISPFRWIVIVFDVLSMLFMYFVARALLPRRGQVILAAIAGTALLHGWYTTFSPNSLGNLAFPLALYLLVRSSTSRALPWRALFIIVVFLYGPFHPVPAFALIGIAAGVRLAQRVLSRWPDRAPVSGFRPGVSAVALVLLFVWVVAWISSFGIWHATVQNLRTLATEGGPTHVQGLVEGIQYARGYGYSVAEQFFKIYGGLALYTLAAAIVVPIVWRKLGARQELGRLLPLYGSLMVVGLAMTAFYFSNLVFSPGRLQVYMLLLCSPFIGFALFEWMNWANQRRRSLRKAALLLSAGFLLGVSLMGILKIYPSPYILGISLQTTRTEVNGMDWFLHKKNPAIYCSAWYYAPGVYARYLLSDEERRGRYDVISYTNTAFPFRLGYDKHSSLGSHYDSDTYLVLRELNRRVYVDVYPDMAPIRLLPGDFERLERDPRVDKLYSNAGFDAYYVHAAAQA